MFSSSVTAHGVGAFWQKPILAKNARGERTLPKIGKGETVFFMVFSRNGPVWPLSENTICGANKRLCLAFIPNVIDLLHNVKNVLVVTAREAPCGLAVRCAAKEVKSD